jgi:uncharacterized protein (DUF2062 family)
VADASTRHRGVVGLLIAFTPTIGVQVVLAAALAPLARANVPAAVAMVWVTNPATMGPAFALTYRVGCAVWHGPAGAMAPAAVAEAIDIDTPHAFFAPWEWLSELLSAGETVIVPLVIGGLIVGGVLALVAYVLTLRVVRAHRRHVAL